MIFMIIKNRIKTVSQIANRFVVSILFLAVMLTAALLSFNRRNARNFQMSFWSCCSFIGMGACLDAQT